MAKKKSKSKKRRNNRANNNRNKLRTETPTYETLEPRQLLATYSVNSTADNTTAGGDLTLREAVIAANNNPGHDTIEFASSIGNQTITLDLHPPGGLLNTVNNSRFNNLVITDSLTIDGGSTANSAHRIKIDADDNSRIFNFVGTEFNASTSIDGRENNPAIGKNLTLTNLELVNGKTPSLNGQGDSGDRSGQRDGGAVRFNSTGLLKLDNVRIAESNTSKGTDTPVFGARGGGISAVGNVELLNGTVIEKNRTDANRANGGGVFSQGTVLVDASTVSGNYTDGSGATGGGISAALGVTVQNNSIIEKNKTAGNHSYGGGIYSGSSVYNLQSQTIVPVQTLVTITDSTIVGNSTNIKFSKGGGIFGWDVKVENSTIEENRTTGRLSFGGAIYAVDDLTIDNSTLHGNSTTGEVSKIAALGCGFGMWVLDNVISAPLGFTSGTLKTILETINSITETVDLDPCPSRANSGSPGGAVFAKNLTLRNSNVTSNRTEGPAAQGGAMFVRGKLIVHESVITGNRTTDNGFWWRRDRSRQSRSIFDFRQSGQKQLHAKHQFPRRCNFWPDWIHYPIGRFRKHTRVDRRHLAVRFQLPIRLRSTTAFLITTSQLMNGRLLELCTQKTWSSSTAAH